MITKTNRGMTLSALRLAAVLLCGCALLAAGCGKKGFPIPKDASRNFSWQETEAKAVGNCLVFSGSFTGAYQNFDGIRLEIAPVNSPEDCPGCPFVPREVTEIAPREAGFDAKAGTVSFSYCPQPANAYRWRLAGISRFNRMPHATMTDRIVIVNHEAFSEPETVTQP